MIKITIPGIPQGKARARARVVRTKAGASFVSMYTPAATRSYEAQLTAYGAKAMKGLELLDGPLTVTVDAIFPVPQSWSRRKWLDAMAGVIRPTGKPDSDNVLKVLDGLNKIVWNDDAQIVDARIRKFYGKTPCLTITIRKTEPLLLEANDDDLRSREQHPAQTVG